ncbi:hypothetical protein AB0B66_38550 [Catellatospora sp. NPDC049111]|uniref:hypothetical protein n=1 Tax=Catellatospora sp. NPDC049111 TaxID=3155271 RepID=UPI0033DCEB7F
MSEQMPDDIAAELVSDPTNPPDVVVMRGFLGKSDRAGFSRLYADLNFSEFVEVADDDVVASRSLAGNQNPLGGTVLWVRRTATLLRATVCTAREHSAFLQGEITAKALHRSRMELPVGRRPVDVPVLRGGPTDPLYYSTCRGPLCEDPGPNPGCPQNTVL